MAKPTKYFHCTKPFEVRFFSGRTTHAKFEAGTAYEVFWEAGSPGEDAIFVYYGDEVGGLVSTEVSDHGYLDGVK